MALSPKWKYAFKMAAATTCVVGGAVLGGWLAVTLLPYAIGGAVAGHAALLGSLPGQALGHWAANKLGFNEGYKYCPSSPSNYSIVPANTFRIVSGLAGVLFGGFAGEVLTAPVELMAQRLSEAAVPLAFATAAVGGAGVVEFMSGEERGGNARYNHAIKRAYAGHRALKI